MYVLLTPDVGTAYCEMEPSVIPLGCHVPHVCSFLQGKLSETLVPSSTWGLPAAVLPCPPTSLLSGHVLWRNTGPASDLVSVRRGYMAQSLQKSSTKGCDGTIAATRSMGTLLVGF